MRPPPSLPRRRALAASLTLGVVAATASACLPDTAFQASFLLTVPDTGVEDGEVHVEMISDRADAAARVSGEATVVVHAYFSGAGTFPAQATLESAAEKERLRLRVWRDADGKGDLDACEPGSLQAVAWPTDGEYAPVWVSTADLVPRGATPGDLTPCDSDGDGVTDDVDCDDTDPGVLPGAVETCDGVDQDCDGSIDEDASDREEYYLDADGDGVATSLARPVVLLCGPEPGWSAVVGDCDDHDPEVHPGAVEVCDGVDQDCDGQADDDAEDAPTWNKDFDRDGYGNPDRVFPACTLPQGYVDDDRDCDDEDDAVNPGVQEVCDGVDQDCDGVVDDGFPALDWYRDLDGDGWGNDLSSYTACYTHPDYVEPPGDCADSDPGIHPAAVELCDGVDQDCDGLYDEGFEVVEWYMDADGDGFGSDTLPIAACAAPAGRVAVDGDCDDGAGNVHPGADEWCDGMDYDCDGEVLEPESVDAPAWHRDADGDAWGTPEDGLVACFAPGGYVERVGDCDDEDPAVHPGVAEDLTDGVDQDCDGRVDAVPCAAREAPAGLMDGPTRFGGLDGAALAAGPDLTGDGLPDLVYGYSSISNTRGEVVLHASPLPVGDTPDIDSVPDLTLLGATPGDRLGARVVAGADLDGDALADLVVATDGTWSFADGPSSTRPLVVLYGPLPTTGASARLGDEGAPRYALIDGSDGGWSWNGSSWPFAPADVDGDGHADLVVGDPGNDVPQVNAGALQVVYGPIAAGEYRAGGAEPGVRVHRVAGPDVDAALGLDVAVLGDLDGDGSQDVAAAGGGGAYVVCGDVSGDSVSAPALLAWDGGAVGSVRAGDLDGDGHGDLVGWNAGGAAVWLAPACREARAGPDVVVPLGGAGSQGYSALDGMAVSDLDADGYADLVASGDWWDGAQDAADVRVWFGGPVLPGTLDPDLAGLRFVQAGTTGPEPILGDVDGDGMPELLVRVLDAGWTGWPFSSGAALVVHPIDLSACGGGP